MLDGAGEEHAKIAYLTNDNVKSSEFVQAD